MVLSRSFSPPGSYMKDSDGYAPPTHGGVVAIKAATIEYTDVAAKTLFILPAGAVPLDWWFDVGTDFDAGTNNNLDIGAAGTADYFANDVAIGTQGLFRAGVANSVDGRLGVQFDEDTTITATYIPSGTSPTTGSGIFFMTYMMQNTEDFTVD